MSELSQLGQLILLGSMGARFGLDEPQCASLFQVKAAALASAGRGVHAAGKAAEETPGISLDDASPAPLGVSWVD